ncbi:MAG: helix-turn-helix domain-containing protein [Pseudomonadota bacterium]|nr:helix-turn-helix domain-containing protein [Pseudomonadota bacterium]
MSSRIRRARSIAALSQSQLAVLTGVNRSAVAQWECSTGTCPSTTHLAQVAVFTDVCFEWLATGRGPCRPDGTQPETLALAMHEFARNDCEAKALELLRHLSPKRQQSACKMLELLAQ